jgi:hypothetical protein
MIIITEIPFSPVHGKEHNKWSRERDLSSIFSGIWSWNPVWADLQSGRFE